MPDKTYFAPTVVVDGRAVTPPGWVWILSLAFGGCQWAIDEASKPEFRRRMIEDMRDAELEDLRDRRLDHERELARIDEQEAKVLSPDWKPRHVRWIRAFAHKEAPHA